ncbi:hypothetical protein HDF18_00475 [Mucilaginibacter sp. X5P1]|uniref:hypothetical protein n=1 Tax=Mucilaginibacter sp. X5P1 TaxID=2723088 RepID=UPI00160B2843|nr:hypothetical protein [Mucilaginibacter sp. X5P1]MBB6138429.1 DNA transposition AAA+ family ATPase [Mucilaginibacter sp. X5P1]
MKSIMPKYLTILLFLFAGLSKEASAQVNIWSVDAAKYVGKTVSFDEYANKVNYNSATKTCLIMLADPDVAKSPTITVIIHNINKGKHLRWLQDLEGYTITITGKLLRDKGGFVINGNDVHTKIEAEKNAVLTDPAPLDPGPPPPDTSHHK